MTDNKCNGGWSYADQRTFYNDIVSQPWPSPTECRADDLEGLRKSYRAGLFPDKQFHPEMLKLFQSEIPVAELRAERKNFWDAHPGLGDGPPQDSREALSLP